MKLEHSAVFIASIALVFAGWCALQTHRMRDQVEWLSGALRARADESATSTEPADESDSGAARTSAFGLPEIMTGIQMDAAKLYLAGKLANWPLAQYEAGRIENALEEVPVIRPQEKGVPLGAVIQAFKNSQWTALKAAINRKDFPAFDTAYTNVVFVCNACHQAVGRPFIHITVPTEPPVPNQLFRPAPPVVKGPMMQ